MRFPTTDAVLAALPFAILSVGDRKAWCDFHRIECAPIERWMNKRGGQPKYARMCQLILACEASGVVFQGDGFFMKPKNPD